MYQGSLPDFLVSWFSVIPTVQQKSQDERVWILRRARTTNTYKEFVFRLKAGARPPRAENPAFKWSFLKNLCSTTGMPFPASLFRSMTHALLFNRFCTRLSAHQPSTATAWTFFQIAWTDSEFRPHPLDVRIEKDSGLSAALVMKLRSSM